MWNKNMYSVSIRETDVQTSYETKSVAFQTEYQPMDKEVIQFLDTVQSWLNI